MAVIPPADVQLTGSGLGNGGGGHGGFVGDVQAGGKIVGAALGQIPQHGGMLQPQHAGDHLVQRAVAAHGHDHVVLLALPGCRLGGVAGAGGGVDGNEIAGLGENGCRVEQRTTGLAAAGGWIDDHQQFFLRHKIASWKTKNRCLQGRNRRFGRVKNSISRENGDCNSSGSRVE